MARTVCSGTVEATPEQLWKVVADPHHLPRWWPGVARVENVREDRFTQVIPTKRGKQVRLDQTVTESLAPDLRAWAQELHGTPFERLLTAWTTTIEIAAQGSGSLVTITERQELRGRLKLGAFLQRRPARKRLKAALLNLQQLFG